MARRPFPWLQSKNQSYAPLIERGYALTSQGRVAVTSAEHAEHIFFRLDPTCSFESPSPINPQFPPAQLTASDGSSAGPAGGTRSGATAAAPAAAAPSDLTRPPRLLTADKRTLFIVSPSELIASVDRQLMECILSKIENSAARIPYRARNNASGRNLIRVSLCPSPAQRPTLSLRRSKLSRDRLKSKASANPCFALSTSAINNAID
eukprot:1705003-Pleurochrysis_carterae.AAC.1